jgi:hypothetical protein
MFQKRTQRNLYKSNVKWFWSRTIYIYLCVSLSVCEMPLDGKNRIPVVTWNFPRKPPYYVHSQPKRARSFRILLRFFTLSSPHNAVRSPWPINRNASFARRACGKCRSHADQCLSYKKLKFNFVSFLKQNVCFWSKCISVASARFISCFREH